MNSRRRRQMLICPSCTSQWTKLKGAGQQAIGAPGGPTVARQEAARRPYGARRRACHGTEFGPPYTFAPARKGAQVTDPAFAAHQLG